MHSKAETNLMWEKVFQNLFLEVILGWKSICHEELLVFFG